MNFSNFSRNNCFCKKCANNIDFVCSEIQEDKDYDDIFKELNIFKIILKEHNLRNSYLILSRIIEVYLNFVNDCYIKEKILYILLNKYNNLLCEKCIDDIEKNFVNSDNIISIYANSYFVTQLFNYITEDHILPTFKLLLTNKQFDNIIKNKLFDFRGNIYGLCKPKSILWKGSEYYFKKIYHFTMYFYEYDPKTKNIEKIIDTPIDIYQKRKNIYLEDYICGHPMASNGWYKEALENAEDLGLFCN